MGRKLVVHFGAMVDNLELLYPDEPLEAYITEVCANAIIDAKATGMHFTLKQDEHNNRVNAYLFHDDNGTGMRKKQFEEYHDLGRVGGRKPSKMGIAGEGIKVIFKRVEYIVTETKAKEPERKFIGASKIYFNEEEDDYWKDDLKPRKRVKFDTGTHVEVKLKYIKEKRKLTKSLIINTIRKWYSAILYGWYSGNMYVNGEKIEPYPFEAELTKINNTTIEGNNVRYLFFKSRDKLPEEHRGLFIVVNGKTIVTRNYESSKIDDYLCGYILADGLRPIITRAKSQFKTGGKPSIKKFDKEMKSIYSDWIEEIDAKAPIDVSKRLLKTAKPIGQLFYKIMKKDFRNLFDELMSKPKKENVIIQSKNGVILAEKYPDKNIVDVGENIKEGEEGDALGKHGDDEISILIPIENGTKRGKYQTRKTRVPEIPPMFVNLPQIHKECWWHTQGEKKSIAINKPHPAFICSDKHIKSREYHIKRCYAKAVADYIKEDKKENEELFHSLLKAMNKRDKT